MTPEWIERAAILLFHEQQIVEHGGAPGIRDEGGLDSALARPQNLHAYGDPDLYQLAAAYAFGIVRNHPFVDGNKRTAFVTSVAFLDLNGQELAVEEAEAARIFLALAAGEVSEDALAAWFRDNCAPPAEA